MNDINPFSPGAGKSPPYLAGREKEQRKLRQALDKLKAGRAATGTTVLYGPCGNGKTVLLNWFAKECEKSNKVSVTTATPRNKMNSIEAVGLLLSPLGWRPAEFSVQIGGLASASWENNSRLQDELERRLISEYRKKPHVLVVDEAHTMDANVCQYLLNLGQEVSSKSPFLLIMAGTPGLWDFLFSVEATFVEREDEIAVGRLDEQASRDAIRIPLEQEGIAIDDDALAEAEADSQHYPYFLQVWGSVLWDEAKQQGRSRLTMDQVQSLSPKMQHAKNGFYRKRYSSERGNPLLKEAMVGIAAAYRERPQFDEEELLEVVARAMPLDAEERNRKAEIILKQLRASGFVWLPGPDEAYEPGIPSLMSYVLSRASAQDLAKARVAQ